MELSFPPNEKDSTAESYRVLCWGCGLQLQLPSFVPVFKCGWCGAITSHDTCSEKRKCCSNWFHVADCILFPVVLMLILLVICAGLWASFPILFPRLSFGLILHSAVTALLAFNTLFNFCLAVFTPAGPPPDLAWGCFQLVGKGSLEGHRFCNICKKPKPSRAHHCRSCKACVVEMDHHCPFIGNCVGAANKRPFLLFLFYALISNLYVLVMSCYTGLQMWPAILMMQDGPFTVSLHKRNISASFLTMLFGSLLYSTRAITLVYLAVASLSLSMVLGLLLHQQLQSIYDGQTYIDSLQEGNSSSLGVWRLRSWHNLEKVFGPIHPLKWLFPRWVHAEVVRKKAHNK